MIEEGSSKGQVVSKKTSESPRQRNMLSQTIVLIAYHCHEEVHGLKDVTVGKIIRRKKSEC